MSGLETDPAYTYNPGAHSGVERRIQGVVYVPLEARRQVTAYMHRCYKSYKEISEYHCHVNQKVLKQRPHMRTRVYLLHLHLGVNVAVIQKVDVRHLHLVTKQLVS